MNIIALLVQSFSLISSMAFHQKYIESFDFALLRYLDDTKELALLLDYDGTLSPLVAHPDLAVLPEKTKIVLDRLSKTPNVFIAIISGRAVHSVKEKVGLDNITYAGNHGIEILYPDGTSYHHPVPEDIKNKFELMSRELEDKLTVYGAWVENKGATLTYHYRSVPEDQKQEIAEQAKAIMEKYGFQVNMAHEAIEVKPPVKWNKGYAAEYILENTFGVDWDSNVTAIFAGDDTTDEDAMKALKGRGLSFRISNNPDVITHADYLLQSTDSVFKMLEWILNYLTNKDQD